MLDIKRIRKEPDQVKELLSRRNPNLANLIDEILTIDVEYRAALQEKQDLEAKRNQLGKLVGQKKAQGQENEAQAVIEELNLIKAKLKSIADNEPILFEKQKQILDNLPNTPSPDVPISADEHGNKEIFKWGTEFQLVSSECSDQQTSRKLANFKIKEHDEIGKDLGILDFERGVKIAKSRFTLLRGLGAKLERALINFMLDKAAENGYEEVFPPILANSESLYGTGQLPKFKEDIFKVENENLYLIPTAEVPVTNIYRDEILETNQLPIFFCAYTPNFRSEAGAAGKDTKGIIRQHQFNKVELVKICKPENSELEHEKLTQNAESVLQALRLPYRKMLLCSGDLGFAAQKCYDLEVWFPGQNKYREISSCSNFGDFQARRAQIRFKRDNNSKAELVHTINGSGLAVGRTLAAILENYQNADGSVTIPTVLVPYMSGTTHISSS